MENKSKKAEARKRVLYVDRDYCAMNDIANNIIFDEYTKRAELIADSLKKRFDIKTFLNLSEINADNSIHGCAPSNGQAFKRIWH